LGHTRARSFIHRVANDDIPLNKDDAQAFWNTTRQDIEKAKGDICDIQQHKDAMDKLCHNHGYTSSKRVWDRLEPLYVNTIKALKNPDKTKSGIPIDYKDNEPFSDLGQNGDEPSTPRQVQTLKNDRRRKTTKRKNFDKISVLEPVLLEMDSGVRAKRAKWENRSTTEQVTIYDPEGMPASKERGLTFSEYFSAHSVDLPVEALPVAEATSSALGNALRRGTIIGFPEHTKTITTAVQWLDDRDASPG